MVYFSPSLLSADFTQLGRDIDDIVAGGCHYIHCDIMDGSFVPAISFGMCVQESIRKCTDMFFDTHLMIERPERYIDDFKNYNSKEDLYQAGCLGLIEAYKKFDPKLFPILNKNNLNILMSPYNFINFINIYF